SGVAHHRRPVRGDGVVGSDRNLSFSSLLVPLCSATRSNGVGVITAAGLGVPAHARQARRPVECLHLQKEIIGPHRDFTFWVISVDGEVVENSHSQCSKVSSKKVATRVKG
ncbi:hypothetical protein ALC57_03998, partial [Trachymyrmex cornetzi]